MKKLHHNLTQKMILVRSQSVWQSEILFLKFAIYNAVS